MQVRKCFKRNLIESSTRARREVKEAQGEERTVQRGRMGYFLSGSVIWAWMVARQLRWQLIQLGQCRIYSENLFACFSFLFWFWQISSIRDAIKPTGFWGQQI